MALREALAAIAALMLVSQSAAQAPAPNPAAPAPAATTAPAVTGHALTADDVNAFLDGLIPAGINMNDIAGATVVVVADGRVVTARGYGYADVANRTPVVAETTAFRPGSISKLFPWTAVMQLVERGDIDLDRDINEYLDFEIPDAFGQPITMRHLMTHTAGFEERSRSLISLEQADLDPLREVVANRIPGRIYPPGAVPAYSNYGTTLAGYIVERVSGVPFDEYVQRNIFAPLGMTHSTFYQPVPETFPGTVAEGYNLASGEPVGFEYVRDTGAGALTATGPDMGRFMLAYLNGGAIPGEEASRILRPETVTLMQAPARVPAPGVSAMALGFYEEHRNGHRLLSHAGDLGGFHSDLYIAPELGAGIFVSFNSGGARGSAHNLRLALMRGFMDRYFPAAPGAASEPAIAAADVARDVAGVYDLSRRGKTSIFAVLSYMQQTVVTVDENGILSAASPLFSDLAFNPLKFEPVGPDMWREVGGQTRLGVHRDENGKIVYISADPFGSTHVLTPTPAYQSKVWITPALVVSLIVIVLAFLSWPLLAGYRAGLGIAGPVRREGRERLFVWGARAAVLSVIVFFIALAALGSLDDLFSSSSVDIILRVIQLFALLVVLGAIAMAVIAVLSWGAAKGRLWRVIGRSVLALSCLMLAYFIVVMGILSPNLNF